MAEIKDVYSLEFNSGNFQSEVDSAIARVEELNQAMADGADVSDELASAQNGLVSVLSQEAKGVEQLNQKRKVLVSTSKSLNVETKTGSAVTNELTNNNKKLAVETGNAAGKQKSLIGNLISGARQLNTMKRAASLLAGAFRLVASALPLGLILSFAGPVLSFFTSLFKGVDKTAENMAKLDDATTGYGERLKIIEDELENLNTIESRRGKLTDEEKARRDDLTKKYQETANEIIKIEQDRLKIQEDLENSIANTRIKILGNSFAGIEAQRNQEQKNRQKDIKKTFDAIDASDKILFDQLKKAKQLEQEEDAKGNMSAAAAARQNAIKIQNELDKSANTLADMQIDTEERKFLIDMEAGERRADLAKRLANEKKQRELDVINKELQDAEDAFKLAILLTEENSEERLAAETNLILGMEDLRKKHADKLGISLTELAILEKENFNKREKLSQDYYDDLEKKRLKDLENYNKMLEDSQKGLADSIKELRESLNTEFDIKENNREKQLAMDLIQLEYERNQKLNYARLNIKDEEKLGKQIEEINKGFDLRREQMELETNKEILKNKIKFLESLRNVAVNQKDNNLVSDLEKQIAQATLKLQDLDKASTDTAEKTKKANLSLKEQIKLTSDLIQDVSDAVFQVLNAQVQAYIDSLDKAADKSRDTLNEIRQNSENYNARQLEIEKERLEKIEDLRAKAVEREKQLALIQLVINSTVAIAKAAAEGGAAAPFTIASTLIALLAGFASARAAAGAAFYEGTEYLNRGNNPSGRDTIPARLNEGERVITTDTNAKYWDVLTAVHNKRIPAEVLNTFANSYQKGGLNSAFDAFSDKIRLSSEMGKNGVFVNVGTDNRGLESRMERIENAIMELPKYMPKTTVNANANGIFRIVEQRMSRSKFSRERAK